MRAGSLDRRLTLERATETSDDFNEPVLTWSALATVWAAHTPLSDGERMRASETAATASSRFLIRWSAAVADVNPKDRLMFGGVVHQILHVKEVGRREGIEITTAARADGA